MTEALYSALKEAGLYDLHLIYSPFSHRDNRNIDVFKILAGHLRPRIEAEIRYGMQGLCIGRRFPALELFHYIGNIPQWLTVIRDYDILQVVSGYNHCGLAFAVSGRRFVCWVASTIDEDKIGKKKLAWLRPLDFAQRFLLRMIEGYIYRRCSHILTLSRYTAGLIRARYGISQNKITVLPCPVDTSQFSPSPTVVDNKMILFVGRITDPRKNVSWLLKVFKEIHNRIPAAKLVLVGDNTDSDAIRTEVQRLVIDRHVRFISEIHRNKIAHWYRQASVLAIPSLQEGLGIVGLEAMSCGVPVVSTRCGGPQDYIEDGKNGFLVDVLDEKVFVDRLVTLLTDVKLRRTFGTQARLDIEEKFSFKQWSSHFEEAYEKIWPELF